MANIPYPEQYDDSFMNIFKRIIDELNLMGYTYEESLQKAQDILDEAQQTNDMNESVQQQINTLIAESGTSDAEVLQARIDAEGNEYPVLKDRLDESDGQLAKTVKRLTHVTYEMFGAKLDGQTDDTNAIREAHDFANDHDLKVIQTKGIIYLTGEINVQTETDLTGCSLLLKDLSDGKTLYHITSKNPEETVATYTQSELTKGEAVFPSLSDYKNHYVRIDSDEVFCTRHSGGDVQPYTKRDSVIVTRDGLATTPLIHDFATGNLTLKARKIDSKPLTFKGLEVVWDFKDASKGCKAIKVERSNTHLIDITLEIPNNIDFNDVDNGNSTPPFSIEYCCNVTINNINAENVRQGKTGANYVFYVERVVDFTVTDSTLLNGWHVFGTNGVKNWKVLNSTVNGLDIHQGAGDIYCNDVKFLGNWGFLLGYGDGRIIFENCTSEIRNIDSKTLDRLVNLSSTYGVSYEGDILVKNHTVVNPNWEFSIVKREVTDHDFGVAYDIKLPNLYVDGVTFKNKVNSEHRFNGFHFENVHYLEDTLINNDKNIVMPSIVDIKNVIIENHNDKVGFRSFSVFLLNTQTIEDRIVGETQITLSNILQSIESKFIVGFLTGDSIGSEKNLINYSSDLTENKKYKIHISIKKCEGKIRAEGITDTIKVSDSVITDADLQYGSGSLVGYDSTFVNSDLYYYGWSGATRAQVMNNTLINCVIHPYMLDGTYQPFQEITTGGEIKRLSGNVFVDQTISDVLADKYWKYVNPTFYKVPTST